MILLIAFLLAIGLFVWGKKIQNKIPNSYEISPTFVISIVAIIITGLIFVITAVGGYCAQISDIENIAKLKETRTIYGAKAETLTAQFKLYLADTYPTLEKEIYENISPKNIELYAVKYPELRSSDTIMKLAESINQLQTDVYDQDIKIAQLEADIRIRTINKFHFYWLYPKYVKSSL